MAINRQPANLLTILLGVDIGSLLN